jgi:autotransporter passenger strand-loop-strand repeat protein
MAVSSGSTASGTTVSSGGIFELDSGGVSSGIVLDLGAIFQLGAGEVLSGYEVSSGFTLNVSNGGLQSSGGTAINTTVDSGGLLTVEGGTVSGATVSNGGTLLVSGGFGIEFVSGVLDNGALIYELLGHGVRTLDNLAGSGSVVVSGGTLQLEHFPIRLTIS